MDAAASIVKPERVLGRVTRRLIPFLALLFLVLYLDRINIGFAGLEMTRDLGFSPAVFGFGAGIFYLGRSLFELPSNLALVRFGARRWIARIMVSWGVVAMAMALVRGEPAFVGLRFCLGVAEAGFLSGVVLYLTFWFPPAQRAQAMALFMVASPLSGVVGGPLAGEILRLDGAAGLAGWQWLFLAEGLPPVLLGIATLYYLADGPGDARWLSSNERHWLTAALARDQARSPGFGWAAARAALLDRRVAYFSVVFSLLVMPMYGIGAWLPDVMKRGSDLGELAIGVLTAAAYLVGAVVAVLNGWHSDRSGERRWHVARAGFACAAGLALAAWSRGFPALGLLALLLVALGTWSFSGPFWAMPTAVLDGTAAAGAGLAVITAVGNLGGFLGPWLVGLLRDATGGFGVPLLVASAAPLLGGLLALKAPAKAHGT